MTLMKLRGRRKAIRIVPFAPIHHRGCARRTALRNLVQYNRWSVLHNVISDVATVQFFLV